MKVELAVTVYPNKNKVVAVRRKDDKVLLAVDTAGDIVFHPDWFKWDITTTVTLPWEKHMDWTIEGVPPFNFGGE